MDFITSSHSLYDRYINEWRLAVRSFYGSVEYRNGQYLKSYAIDNTTPSEVITTYDLDGDGNQTGKYSTRLAGSKTENEAGLGTSSFYTEKLENVPVFPYTRLYVSEYNAILFRNTPTRDLPDNDVTNDFINDVDGEGNSINEFMSMVDCFTTVCGVVWISCIKPGDSPYAKLKMYKPTDVTNWEYSYDNSGNLVLKKLVLKIDSSDAVDVYQYLTAETIDTVFVIKDEEKDLDLPEAAEKVITDDGDFNYYIISQENELGYIPVRPVYQSNKIYNGVGHTPIFDIAQIQRSIYGDMGEIYSAVSYGSHPVNLVDDETAQLNGGSIGAEPGTVVRVMSNQNGQPQHVFEFVAPPLDSISELRELIDGKIEKMNTVAMIRSEDIVKASTSGAHLEQYDSKLEAFIRKKATSLENAEIELWKMWYDWNGTTMPEDFYITYNRLYSQKGLSNEIKETKELIELVEAYDASNVTEEDAEFSADIKAELKDKIVQLMNSSHSQNSL